MGHRGFVDERVFCSIVMFVFSGRMVVVFRAQVLLQRGRFVENGLFRGCVREKCRTEVGYCRVVGSVWVLQSVGMLGRK